MRIALIGNQNNNLNVLTRYLRDYGYDAHLMQYHHEPPHFKPECDTFGNEYLEYSHVLDWGTYKSYFTNSSNSIAKSLEAYDFLIGSRLAPAFAMKARRKLNIFVPSGGEIWTLPFFAGWKPTELLKYLAFSKIQKKAIQQYVEQLVFDYTNEEVEAKVKALGFTTSNRIVSNPPFLYLPEYNEESLLKNSDKCVHQKLFKEIRSKHDLVIFHHSSHWWKNIPEAYHHDKGNDRLFKGFAEFIKKNPTVKACIATVKYGPDAENSMKLCSELGISEKVIWLPHMTRKEIMMGILMSDIVAGEFKNSWFSYGAIFEGLALKKTVMHYREDNRYTDRPEGLYPMMTARYSEDISNVLNNYIKNPGHFKNIGEQGYDWFVKYAINEPLKKIVQLIEDKRNSHNESIRR
jgi:glycosyltransferase involved in cell wall biosynthesis